LISFLIKFKKFTNRDKRMVSCDVLTQNLNIARAKYEKEPLKLSKRGVKVDVSMLKSIMYFPEELIMQIFSHLDSEALTPTFSQDAVRSLLRSSQVCRQWQRLSEETLSKIYKRVVGNQERLNGMSWGRTLGLLYNWEKQIEKVTYISISRLSIKHYQAVQCHLPIDLQNITYDKIQINSLRILLSNNMLMAGLIKKTDDGKEYFKRIWCEAVENPEKSIFVSTDGNLIATQHYSQKRGEHSGKKYECCFNVYALQTGRLIGKVKIESFEKEEKLNLTHVQFDLSKFQYLKNGREVTRYYDPCVKIDAGS
jgi:hypothetical protein